MKKLTSTNIVRFDDTDMSHNFMIITANIEMALLAQGAEPGKDYNYLDLYKLAAPFVLEGYKVGKAQYLFHDQSTTQE